MSDELFRARVEPRRAHGSTPDARTRSAAQGADHAEEVLEDLMASFERRDAGPVGIQGPGNSAVADRLSPDAAPADEISEPSSWRATDPATLPSRRSVVPNRRARDPWLLGGAVLVITAGVTAAVMSSPLFGDGHASQGARTGATALADPSAPVHGPPAGPGPANGPDAGSASSAPSAGTGSAATPAAAWIAAHVGAGYIVACDTTVCTELRKRGIPGTALVPIGVQSGLAQIEGADVVAVSDTLRGRFGASLAGITAGEPLAVFAAGGSTVAVTPVILDGPKPYAGRLAADRAARKAAGAALLRNARITIVGAARTALADGTVDSRVCMLLATLGGSHRLVVAGFTGAGPGAGTDYPLPGVVISEIDGVAAEGASSQAAQLRTTVSAQRAPYAPLSATPVAAGAGRGLAIVFAQPGPLGLLTGTTS